MYWFKDWCDREPEVVVRWNEVPLDKLRWSNCIKSSIANMIMYQRNNRLEQQRTTQKIYKQLAPANGKYCNSQLSYNEIMWVTKARCDVLNLNVNKFEQNADKRCSLCNTNEVENVLHFIGKCPILKEF